MAITGTGFAPIAVPTLAYLMAVRVVATADAEAAGGATSGAAAAGAATGAAVWAAAASFY